MTRFQIFLAAAAALVAFPAFAHDGVAVSDPYARTNGGMGASGAVFLLIENHSETDDRLIGVASEVAEMVQMHTHKEDANGVMQMMEVPEGFPVPASDVHELARGGDHIMLMGLKQDLKDGDTFSLTLTFEHAGDVVIEVPVDNARKDGAMGGMNHMNHGNGAMTDSKSTTP